MYKVFGFLTKRDGLSVPEFKDHYENHHVPPLLTGVRPNPRCNCTYSLAWTKALRSVS